jgi:hypothetical protein
MMGYSYVVGGGALVCAMLANASLTSSYYQGNISSQECALVGHYNNQTEFEYFADYSSGTYRIIEIDEDVDHILNGVKAIESFASNLLQNMKDLDPECAKVIDECFWDMV